MKKRRTTARAQGRTRRRRSAGRPSEKETAKPKRIETELESLARRHAEEALRESETRYRRLFETIQESFALLEVITDEHGHAVDFRYLDVNPAFERNVRRAREQLVGRTYREIAAAGGANPQPEWIEIIGQVSLTGVAVSAERLASFTDRWVQFHAFSPRHGQCAVISLDITERKRTEAEQERLRRDLERRTIELEATNRELEALVYSVAHDLRGPLQQMSELSRAMLEDYAAQLPADSQPLIQIIHDHAAATNFLAEDLLTLSRVTQVSPAKRTVHMTDLVRQCLDELCPQGIPAPPAPAASSGTGPSECKGRQVEINLADLPAAQADPVLVKQVWVNLLANALKFTREREPPRIEIGWQREKGATVYYVKDNGVGFDMAQVDRLFRAFHRLHHAEEFEGNGLGLAIVQRIVERHGGRAWAEGAIDQGAAFYFTLERAALGDSPNAAQSSVQRISPESQPVNRKGTMIRVLVVDDHQLFRQGLQLMLLKANDIQIVGEARDGKEAIELAQSLQPDVILMDIEMPGMNGLEATETLKAMGHPARILMRSPRPGVRGTRSSAQSDGASGAHPHAHDENG